LRFVQLSIRRIGHSFSVKFACMEITSKLFVVLALAAVSVGVGAVGQKNEAIREQSSFSVEEPIKHPVTLSSEVVEALLGTAEARTVDLSGVSSAERANLFEAVEVHLGGSEEVDLVVAGVPPLRGADNDWFWVVRSAHKNPRIILFVGGYTLDVLGTKTNGLRDIRSTWSTPSETYVTTYHFDGRRYKTWKTESTSNSN
jgi:hypothetical protein